MKHKIYSTGNETLKGDFNISYYIFEKDNSFLDWLGKLLTEVFDIKNGEQQAKFVIKEKDTEEGMNEEIFIKEINKMTDLHEKYKNKGERADVFYGKDRVYVTLRKSKEIRKKFADFVKKTKEWVEIKESKEIPIYLKKQEKINLDK